MHLFVFTNNRKQSRRSLDLGLNFYSKICIYDHDCIQMQFEHHLMTPKCTCNFIICSNDTATILYLLPFNLFEYQNIKFLPIMHSLFDVE